MIDVEFATEGVAEKIIRRNLTLNECIEILDNNPYEIRSGTDDFHNPKFAAFGKTYAGKFAMVVYAVERPNLYKILSARTNLADHEVRNIRKRRR